MAVKIKLKRIGKMGEPHYRIVIADARTKRGGRAIEEIGQYHPIHDPSVISVDSDRVQYWLGVGAQPTEAVAAILRVTGDWQKFRGEPAPEPMKMAAPKADKKLAYESALKNKDAEAAAEAKPVRAKKTKAAEPAAEPVTEPVAEVVEETAAGDAVVAEVVETPVPETPVPETPVPEAPADEAADESAKA